MDTYAMQDSALDYVQSAQRVMDRAAINLARWIDARLANHPNGTTVGPDTYTYGAWLAYRDARNEWHGAIADLNRSHGWPTL